MDFNIRTLKAIELAKQAGEMMLEYKKNKEIDYEVKGLKDIVTVADKTIEKFVFKNINKSFSDDSILSEEGDNIDNGSIKWIIDPIDGTTNFYWGFPAYCISIGYKDAKGIVGGVVYQPTLKELFVAERGKGAFLNEEKIQVSKIKEHSNALIVMGFANRNPELWEDYSKIYTKVMPEVADIRRTGSAALDLCYVACGRFALYYEPAVKIWDIAAGSIILTEAGGSITNRYGEHIELEKEDCSVLASNRYLHDWILDYVR